MVKVRNNSILDYPSYRVFVYVYYMCILLFYLVILLLPMPKKAATTLYKLVRVMSPFNLYIFIVIILSERERETLHQLCEFPQLAIGVLHTCLLNKL